MRRLRTKAKLEDKYSVGENASACHENCMLAKLHVVSGKLESQGNIPDNWTICWTTHAPRIFRSALLLAGLKIEM